LIGWRFHYEIKKKQFTAALHLRDTQPLLSKDRSFFCSMREFSPASIFLDFFYVCCVCGAVWTGRREVALTEKSAKFETGVNSQLDQINLLFITPSQANRFSKR